MKSHSPEFFKVTGNVLNVKNMPYDWNGSSDLSFVWHQHHQQQSCYRLTLHVNKETRERITYIFASLYCTIHFKALYLLLDQGPMLQSQLYFIPLPLPLPTWNRVAMNRGENIPLKKWDTATTPLHVIIRHPQLIYQRKMPLSAVFGRCSFSAWKHMSLRVSSGVPGWYGWIMLQ